MRSDRRHRIEVNIFGEEYTLKSSSNPEHMKKVASVVDETMNKIAESKPRISLHQIAVLAALNLADEYLKLEDEHTDLLEMLDEKGETDKGDN
ncbi:cell division protein ZapA [Natranaerobius thermophilus]|uniref:cell division protein ZapA n=1 Tax=Natranaerobius thermophilus TaxID=375929 RepID=UPI00059D300A|nr:cell division protein ZapA [Natranaerobius thermophilus]